MSVECSSFGVAVSGIAADAAQPAVTVEDGATADARVPLAGEGQESPRLENMLIISCCLIYACVYSMPTLMPFIALDYCKNDCTTAFDKTQKQQMLLAMTVLQNICDVSGRLVTAYVSLSSRPALLGWATAM